LRRYYAIEALRCVLTLWVAVRHAGVFPLFGEVGLSHPGFRCQGVSDLGPGATRFCIDCTFVESAGPCPIVRFYAWRYLRILIPVAFMVARSMIRRRQALTSLAFELGCR